MLVELGHVGNLLFAGTAPGGPEVDVEHLTLEVARAVGVAVDVVELADGSLHATLGILQGVHLGLECLHHVGIAKLLECVPECVDIFILLGEHFLGDVRLQLQARLAVCHIGLNGAHRLNAVVGKSFLAAVLRYLARHIVAHQVVALVIWIVDVDHIEIFLILGIFGNVDVLFLHLHAHHTKAETQILTAVVELQQVAHALVLNLGSLGVHVCISLVQGSQFLSIGGLGGRVAVGTGKVLGIAVGIAVLIHGVAGLYDVGVAAVGHLIVIALFGKLGHELCTLFHEARELLVADEDVGRVEASVGHSAVGSHSVVVEQQLGEVALVAVAIGELEHKHALAHVLVAAVHGELGLRGLQLANLITHLAQVGQQSLRAAIGIEVGNTHHKECGLALHQLWHLLHPQGIALLHGHEVVGGVGIVVGHDGLGHLTQFVGRLHEVVHRMESFASHI